MTDDEGAAGDGRVGVTLTPDRAGRERAFGVVVVVLAAEVGVAGPFDLAPPRAAAEDVGERAFFGNERGVMSDDGEESLVFLLVDGKRSGSYNDLEGV